jgi:hypothetical protein
MMSGMVNIMLTRSLRVREKARSIEPTLKLTNMRK